MAACRVAAARCSHSGHTFVVLVALCTITRSFQLETHTYNCHKLLTRPNNGAVHHISVDTSTPPEIARAAPGTPEAARQRRRHCECRQKGGKRRRVRSRLKAKPFKAQLSTIFLSNARPIRNKMDEIRLQLLIQIHMDNCKSLIFTETWLDSTTLAVAIELAGCTNYRVDRTAD